ncbi:MAG: hypothetical protein F6J89_00465 [Symploca sp. SIO1C4]|uniref:HEPN AbiU2-like domain-containing protein n=1 Tax=Symploca sp. SIO1C4 TaxID=2607765 RepID=A0A6B3N3T7_9CYAN|nr:hypothetical protein [Symploca sp. SIO1C4]
MSVSKKDFKAKINQVGENLYFSHCYFKIHEKMTEELNACLEEYPPFFYWSRMAHYEAGILRLTRAYDANSLGLLKMINILQSNYEFWGLTDVIDINQLEQDTNFVEPKKNILVDGLVKLRNTTICHTDNKLHPRKLNFDIEEIYEGKLICREGRITTEEIERLPSEEKEKRLFLASCKLSQAMEKEEREILGKQIPCFFQFYELIDKGIQICNRYMQKLEMSSIELELW